MKSFAIALGLLTLFAATASAGDQAVSNATLDRMGLGGMQAMSDADGLEVRGKGVFDNLSFGEFSGFSDFGQFGGVGIPAEFQLGNALGNALGSSLFQAVLDAGVPADIGIPTDLGLGGLFGGLNF